MWNDAFPSFLIGLREGLEAGLIVSILIATLVRAGQRSRLGSIWAGVGAAVALSLSFAAVLTFTAADLPTGGQDIFGGILSLVAVTFVTAMVFWMRRSAREFSGDIKTRVNEALAKSGAVLAVTAFIAVAREGLETSLFLWTTAKSAGESQGPMIGAAVGLVLAVVACWALYRRVLKINLTKFFSVTGAVLIVIAAGVLAYGLGDLQESGWIPGHTAYAFNLTSIDSGSWYATLIAGTLNLTPAMSWLQVIGYVLYLPITMFLFVRGIIQSGKAAPAPAAAAPATPAVPLTKAQQRVAARVADEQALADRIAAKRTAKEEREAARRVPKWAVSTSIFAVPAVGAVAAIAVLGTSSTAAASTITSTEKLCGSGWTSPSAGAQTFTLSNSGHSTVEVYLINPTNNAVYGEIENLAPGTTNPMKVSLSAGSYAFRCAFSSGTVLNSKTYTVTGSGGGGTVAGLTPVTDQDLQQPVADYRAYVQQQLPVLMADSQKLQADLAQGNLAKAKTDWLTAHLDYEGLGAAYGTFGDFDSDINARATGLENGVNNTDWIGFHRIEYGLWHGQSAAELKPFGDKLIASIQGLIKDFPTETTDPNDLPLRSHEILENALQFQLTGIADYGSGTELATLSANLHGTQVVFSTLLGLMQTRDPAALKAINTWIQTMAADLNAAHNPDGSWMSLQQLSTDQRATINGDLGQLLEQLSIVPDLLEERTTA